MDQLIDYDSLRVLSDKKVDFVSLLQVVHRWYEPENQFSPRRLLFVVRDLDGDRVQGTVDNHLIDDFDHLIRKGRILKFSRFSAIDSKYYFPPSRIPNSILLLKTTSVQRVEHQNFRDSLFSFTKIPDIINGIHWDGISMFDVIGIVVDIKYHNADQEGNQSMVLLLQDQEENQIQCVLTGECYNEFHSFFESFWLEEENLAVILQFCGSEMLNGNKVLKSHDFITSVLVNQELEEICDFKKGLKKDLMMCFPHGSGLKEYAMKAARDDFMSDVSNFEKIAVLTKSLKAGFVWVFGTIQEIIWDEGWFSTRCRLCDVDECGGRVHCVRCKAYIGDNAVYRFTVRIVDGESSLKLLFLDDTANYLIEKDARYVVQEQVDDANRFGKIDPYLYDAHNLKYPVAIKQLLGTDHFFKVQLAERGPLDRSNIVYQAHKVCSDEELTGGYNVNDGPRSPISPDNSEGAHDNTGSSTAFILRRNRCRTKLCGKNRVRYS